MKNLILISFTALLLTIACKKSTTTPTTKVTAPVTATCGITISNIKDVAWKPVNPIFATLTFSTNGSYFENATNIGNWALVNNCDSIHITGSKNFYYQVNSVTIDTLKIVNPTFGQVIFHK